MIDSAERLLQQLIRFDTTNPPGGERACIEFIRELLENAGIAVTILARDPERPNLLARLSGSGAAPPLLLYGHVDVVTTVGQQWEHPPFSGEIIDGNVWGRGALDMKGGVAMMLAAFLDAAARSDLPRDIVLAIVSDEEAGGTLGARFLVDEHAGRFAGIRHAIGEFGGFTLHMGGRKFYPIMVGEKRFCRVRMSLRGPGGHGSLPVAGGTVGRLGLLLQQLDRTPLPIRITPVVRTMIETIAGGLPTLQGIVLRRLLNPRLAPALLRLPGPLASSFSALLRNTVSPTIISAGSKINVIPSEAHVELDARLLPGATATELRAQLAAIVGPEVEIAIDEDDDVSPASPDMGLFERLASIIRALDPEGIPVPLLLPAVTDGRHFARLGIQTYGFLPMNLPAGLDFMRLIHAANERIPVEALRFGARALSMVVTGASAEEI
jgi:acetylornithine deacetylase/succinyl-diaminopimelate desuccinylase-like protein